MSETKVGLDSEVGRKTGSENDSDATPTGGAWEGPDSIAAGSQVGDLCLIPVGAEPGLGQEHQVDCIVVNVVGDFTSFFWGADGAGIKQCRTPSRYRGTSRGLEGNTYQVCTVDGDRAGSKSKRSG